MIDEALEFLAKYLNEYLNRIDQLDEPLAELCNVAKGDGSWGVGSGKIGLSLINIEEERVFKEQETTFRLPSGEFAQYNPELKLNLYVLISANFVGDTATPDFYKQGLKQMSNVISSFQGKNVFTPENTPSMVIDAPSIQKLIVELYSSTFEQQYNFWNVLGAKYLPSMLYKVRLVTIQQKEVQSQGDAILSITVNTTGK